jgi:hypothetical protein
MDKLDHPPVANIVSNIASVQERARLSCISRVWRECVESSWTEVDIRCFSDPAITWLETQAMKNPGLLRDLILRLPGNSEISVLCTGCNSFIGIGGYG